MTNHFQIERFQHRSITKSSHFNSNLSTNITILTIQVLRFLQR